MSIFDNIDMLVETKEVKLKANDKEFDFKFKALTTEDLFYLFNNYPEFINFLFKGKLNSSNEEFSNVLFTKYPRVASLILALTVIDEQKDLEKKSNVFNQINATFQLEAINAVIDLTFESGIEQTIKKWETGIQKILEKFFLVKEKTQTGL